MNRPVLGYGGVRKGGTLVSTEPTLENTTLVCSFGSNLRALHEVICGFGRGGTPSVWEAVSDQTVAGLHTPKES